MAARVINDSNRLYCEVFEESWAVIEYRMNKEGFRAFEVTVFDEYIEIFDSYTGHTNSYAVRPSWRGFGMPTDDLLELMNEIKQSRP